MGDRYICTKCGAESDVDGNKMYCTNENCGFVEPAREEPEIYNKSCEQRKRPRS